MGDPQGVPYSKASTVKLDGIPNICLLRSKTDYKVSVSMFFITLTLSNPCTNDGQFVKRPKQKFARGSGIKWKGKAFRF